jgi:hypothetical protein
MNRRNAALFVLALTLPLSAQVRFERFYGGAAADIGRWVEQTSDSGYIIVGQTKSFGLGSWDVYLVKTDQYGNQEWQRTFGGANDDLGSCVRQLPDGGFVIAGQTNSFGGGGWNSYCIRTDPLGNPRWERTYDCNDYDDWVCAVRQAADGGFLLCGFQSDWDELYVIKTDTAGNAVWRLNPTSSVDVAYSIDRVVNNQSVVAGANSGNIALARITSGGTVAWERELGAGCGYGIVETRDGGYAIAGVAGDNACLLATDTAGSLRWQRTYGGASMDFARSVCQTSDGGYVVGGYTLSLGTNGDVYLLRADAYGNRLWQANFGGLDFDTGYCAQQTIDGGYAVVGMSASSGFYADAYLVKTDSLGSAGLAGDVGGATPLCVRAWPNPAGGLVTIHVGGIAGPRPGRLAICDVSGRPVTELELDWRDSSCKWDGTTRHGKRVSPGIYLATAVGAPRALALRIAFCPRGD